MHGLFLVLLVQIGFSEKLFAVNPQNLKTLKVLSDTNQDTSHGYLKFIESIKNISKNESKTTQEVVKELQLQDPDYATQVAEDEDFWRLCYLLDNGWDISKPNSKGKNLLNVVLRVGHEPNIDLVLKMGGKKILEENKISDILEASGLPTGKTTSMYKKLSAWKKNPKARALVEGIPDTFHFEGLTQKQKTMRAEMAPGFGAGAAPLEELYTTVEVPYATNRASDSRYRDKLNTPDGAANYYSYLNSSALSYGIAQVTIPRIHEKGQLEDRGLFEFKRDPTKHVILEKISLTNENDFFQQVKKLSDERINLFPGNPNAKEVFVYVHGFNVDYNYAMRKTAQLIYDMDYPGLPLAFSWPARAVKIPIPGDFRDDVSRAQDSITMLETFLVNVKNQFPDRKLNIIAHSLGTRVLSQVIVDMSKNFHPDTATAASTLFGEVILAAPAIDADVFDNQWAKLITPLCDRVSILASSEDVALKIEFLAEDTGFLFPLGLWSDSQAALPASTSNYDLSDLSLGTFSLDHSLYSQVPQAIDHMAHLLKEHPTEAALFLDPFKSYLQPLQREDFYSGKTRPYWKLLKP